MSWTCHAALLAWLVRFDKSQPGACLRLSSTRHPAPPRPVAGQPECLAAYDLRAGAHDRVLDLGILFRPRRAGKDGRAPGGNHQQREHRPDRRDESGGGAGSRHALRAHRRQRSECGAVPCLPPEPATGRRFGLCARRAVRRRRRPGLLVRQPGPRTRATAAARECRRPGAGRTNDGDRPPCGERQVSLAFAGPGPARWRQGPLWRDGRPGLLLGQLPQRRPGAGRSHRDRPPGRRAAGGDAGRDPGAKSRGGGAPPPAPSSRAKSWPTSRSG